MEKVAEREKEPSVLLWQGCPSNVSKICLLSSAKSSKSFTSSASVSYSVFFIYIGRGARASLWF